MRLRERVKQHTKAELRQMTPRQVEAHVSLILREAAKIKPGDGRDADLTYLYKALPGDRKTPAMKAKILPYRLADFRKKATARR